MSNIAFDFYCDETPLLFNVSKLFSEKNKIFGISMGKRYSEYLSKSDKINIISISKYIEKNWDLIDISLNNIKEIEQKYNIPNLSFFILSDRYLYNLDYDYSLKILVGTFLFYENFFEIYKIDIFIDTPAAILSQLVCFHVAKKRSVKYLAIRVTRSKNASYTFINDWQDNWYRVIEMYKKNMFTKNNLIYANKIYNDFLNKNQKPSYMSAPKQFNKIQFSFIKEFFKRFIKYYLAKQYKDKYDYITQSPFFYVKRDLGKIINSKFQNIIHSSLFDSIDTSKAFYLFPLHLQPEASTLMMAPYYVNQIATIENIAKSLPAGHYLYVKEHTSSYGLHDINFYKQIKSIPNVKLVSPFYETKLLLKKAIAPIVLTSTVGWEGLLLGKPVIVLGEVFYNLSGMTYKVNSYEELTDVLSNKVFQYKFNKEKLISFIAAIEESSYKGIFAPATFREKEILSDENIYNLFKGIEFEINNNNSNI